MDRHTPSALQTAHPARRSERFGVGYERPDGTVGFIAGPFATIGEALEESPENPLPDGAARAVIVHFKADWTDAVAYRWDGGSWVAV